MSSLQTAAPGLLATRSDVFTAATSTSYVAGPEGSILVHTRSRRDFHFGNYLQLPGPPTPSGLDRWIDVWRSAFGTIYGIARLVIQWEGAEPVDEIPQDVAARQGWVVETDDVLRLDGVGAGRPHIIARQLAHPWEWDAVAELIADGQLELVDLYRWRMTQLRQRVDAGQGQWWGIYEQDMVVASAGIFWGDGLLRFQNVVTHRDHRRQGLASNLLRHLIWLHRHRGEVVIVAPAGGDAGRLYRRLGFRQVGVQQALVGDFPSRFVGATS